MSSRPRPPNFGLQNKIKHYLTRLPFLILDIPVFRLCFWRWGHTIHQRSTQWWALLIRCSSLERTWIGKREVIPSVGKVNSSFSGYQYAISLRLFMGIWCCLKIKSSSWFSIFSLPDCMEIYWYCEENLDVEHKWKGNYMHGGNS